MNPFERIAEERIREAMQAGELSNLPGEGQRLDLSGYFNLPPHLRMGYQLLKHAGVFPAELSLRQEIRSLRLKAESCSDPETKKGIYRLIENREIEYQIRMEKLKKK